MPKKMTRLRHWRQQFDKHARFVWRRSLLFAGEITEPGTPVPESLLENKAKLRNFWEAQKIELVQIEDDPETQELPDGVSVECAGGSWFRLTTPEGEEKVNGQAALDSRLAELRAATETREDDETESDGEGSEGEHDGEADQDPDAEDPGSENVDPAEDGTDETGGDETEPAAESSPPDDTDGDDEDADLFGDADDTISGAA